MIVRVSAILSLLLSIACGNVRSAEPPDAAPPPDAVVPTAKPSSVVPSGGGGTTQSPRHKARIVIGAPQPSGISEDTTRGARVGAPVGR